MFEFATGWMLPGRSRSCGERLPKPGAYQKRNGQSDSLDLQAEIDGRMEGHSRERGQGGDQRRLGLILLTDAADQCHRYQNDGRHQNREGWETELGGCLQIAVCPPAPRPMSLGRSGVDWPWICPSASA